MYELQQSIACSFATGVSVSTYIPIEQSQKVAVEFPTFAAGEISSATANFFFMVCKSSGGTFRRIQAQGLYSSSSGIRDIEIPSTGGGMYVHVPELAGYNFMKVESTRTATGGYTPIVHIWRGC
jgi:hypothetical protein